MRKFTITGIYETSLRNLIRLTFRDIDHIRRLNGWKENQVSGFEIFINDFDELDL
jgi:lipoprotein-releasing system permease protein